MRLKCTFAAKSSWERLAGQVNVLVMFEDKCREKIVWIWWRVGVRFMVGVVVCWVLALFSLGFDVKVIWF